MRRRLSFLALWAGVVLLVAAFFVPVLRPEWSDTRGWIAGAGFLLVLASIGSGLDFGRRVTRYGLNTIVLVVLVLGLIAFVEAVSYRHSARLDLTENRRHSLSPQTIQLLRGLKTDVAAAAFFRSDQPGKKLAEDLLRQYAGHAAGRFTWKMSDPDREPGLARRYGVETYGTIVLETKAKSEKVMEAEEEKLTNGLVKVSRGAKLKVYLSRGHGELDPASTDRAGFSAAKVALERANYEIGDVLLAREARVPDDAALVIVAGPRQDLLPPEIDALSSYVGKGGKLLVMAPSALDTQPARGQSLEKYLAKNGLALADDFVIELNPLGRIFGYGPEVPIVMQYDPHPITRGMGNLMTVFPLTRSIKVGSAPANTSAQSLARTSAQSWGETNLVALRGGSVKLDPEDAKGPLTVAAVATAGKARIVVYGSSSLAGNQFLGNPSVSNRDFFLNTVSWLTEQEDLISIRPKEAKQTPVMLTAQQGQAVFLLPVIVLPGLALAVGILVLTRRRSAK